MEHLLERPVEPVAREPGRQRAFGADDDTPEALELADRGVDLREAVIEGVVRGAPGDQPHEDERLVTAQAEVGQTARIRCEAAWVRVGQFLVAGVGPMLGGGDAAEVAARGHDGRADGIGEEIRQGGVLGVVEDDGRDPAQPPGLRDERRRRSTS